MISLGMSVVGMLLGAVLEALFRAVVPGCGRYPTYALDDNREGLDARLGVRLGDVTLDTQHTQHEYPAGGKLGEAPVHLAADKQYDA